MKRIVVDPSCYPQEWFGLDEDTYVLEMTDEEFEVFCGSDKPLRKGNTEDEATEMTVELPVYRVTSLGEMADNEDDE